MLFSACAFGGSQSAVVSDAASIERKQRRNIAREIGVPATQGVVGLDGLGIFHRENEIDVDIGVMSISA